MQLQITAHPNHVLSHMKTRKLRKLIGPHGTIQKIVRNKKYGIKIIVTVSKRYAKTVVPKGCTAVRSNERTSYNKKSSRKKTKAYVRSLHPRNLDGGLIYDEFYDYEQINMENERVVIDYFREYEDDYYSLCSYYDVDDDFFYG